METVTAKISDSSQRFPLVKSIDTLSGILDHLQIIFFRQFHNRIHLTSHTGIMNRHDGFRLFCDRRLDFCLVDIHGVRTDIHKHAGSSPENESIRRRYKRIRRHNDFIPRLDIRQISRHFQRMGTGSGKKYFF